MGHRWPEPHAFLENHQSGSLGFSSSRYLPFRSCLPVASGKPAALHLSCAGPRPPRQPTQGWSKWEHLLLAHSSKLHLVTSSGLLQIPSEQGPGKALLFLFSTVSHFDDSTQSPVYVILILSVKKRQTSSQLTCSPHSDREHGLQP